MKKLQHICILVLWSIIYAAAQKTVVITVVEEATCVTGFALRFNTHQSDLLPTEYCLSMADDLIFEQIEIEIKYWECEFNYAGTYCPSQICFYSGQGENVMRNQYKTTCPKYFKETICKACPSTIQCSNCLYNNDHTSCYNKDCQFSTVNAKTQNCSGKDSFGETQALCCTSYSWNSLNEGLVGICTTGTLLQNGIVELYLKNSLGESNLSLILLLLLISLFIAS